MTPTRDPSTPSVGRLLGLVRGLRRMGGAGLRMRSVRWSLTVAFGLCMTAGGAMLGWYVSQRPVAVVSNVHEVDGIAVRGGWLDLDVSLVRNRLCDSRAERWFWQDIGGGKRRWVQLPDTAVPPVPIGTGQHYVLSLPIPGSIPAGHWNYLSRIRDECAGPLNWNAPVFRESREVPVEILDPPMSRPAEVIAPPGPVTILPGGGN